MNNLVGPITSPKYPTPWIRKQDYIFSNDGKQVAVVFSFGDLVLHAVNKHLGGIDPDVTLSRSLSTAIGPKPKYITPFSHREKGYGAVVEDAEGEAIMTFGVGEDSMPLAELVAESLNEVFGVSELETILP